MVGDFMTKKLNWTVRITFVLYLVYVYLTVYRLNSFYSFLLLNTFLAYIPIEISMHLKAKQPKLLYWGLFILWLLFYPNAPYVITDLFHLARMNPYDPLNGLMSFNLHKWLNFTNLVTSAFACSIVGTWSLEHVAQTLQARFKLRGWGARNLLVLILTLASSIGIYVGRFLRLHTAYLFLEPDAVVKQLIEMWSPRMLIFVIFMTIIQLSIWAAMTIGRLLINQYDQQNNLL
ncbi:hypothetical protein FC32_GL001995 [Ligilactobacillus apodemi DSM 16634 = JCM 16172]|uniref:Uncharacterized protein n=2 Tax=Ligilactobacillus TaxID=2767887 RepID=A0A0R1TYE7_9LACO|nr:hypothetical protein FC32_GL001995 [Ligilactobacillus apodemi DSM 16634 = JCM 16172]